MTQTLSLNSVIQDGQILALSSFFFFLPFYLYVSNTHKHTKVDFTINGYCFLLTQLGQWLKQNTI